MKLGANLYVEAPTDQSGLNLSISKKNNCNELRHIRYVHIHES